MTTGPDTLEARLRVVFRKVFRRRLDGDVLTVDDIEEWDSLSHIALVMELESQFDMEIDPDSIAPLYSNSAVILDFLRGLVVKPGG
ncbi:MAG: acyl carrier protein [Phycisphaerales bacterium]|nr:MAG: acyl carrier protein [Phycisphaerales bacterium]